MAVIGALPVRPTGLQRQGILRLLDFAGLASKGGASIRTLSGGMKRRLTRRATGLRRAGARADRMEIAGETAFCYARDAAPLLPDLNRQTGVRYLHRPANREDLFFKLTGRELRD